MIACPHCKQTLAAAANFCPHCGKALRTLETGENTEATVKDLLEKRSEGAIAKFFDEFRSLRPSMVLPVRLWVRDRPWTLVWVRWFVFFGLFPLALRTYFNKATISLENAAWALGLYFALLWAFVLKFCLLPEKVRLSLIAKVTLFTIVLSGSLVAFIALTPLGKDIYSFRESTEFFPRLFGYIFGVGLVEEFVKALPLGIFLYRHRRTQEFQPKTYAFVGALSGLAFGVSEAVGYSVLYAAGLKLQVFGYGDYLVVQFLRWATLPLLHAVFSGIVGYFLGLAAQQPSIHRALISIGLLMASVLHGFYNTLTPGWWSVAVGTLSLVIFVSYVRSDGFISSQLLKDEEEKSKPMFSFFRRQNKHEERETMGTPR